MLLRSLTTECALAQTYLSDMAWTSAVSGWGPVEKDKTNGGQGSGDGGPLILNGVTFAKGLGAHANSDIRYNLAGSCSTFSAQVGVDDDAGNNGSIVFQVLADGVKIYDSGPVYGWGATQSVNVSVAGKNELALIINDAGDGAGWDHGDWADAKVTCNGTPSGGQYLSDMTWTSATNGWGPVERDRTNGDLAAGDGGVITLAGRTYAKGLGVHANSDIRFALSGGCSTFTADVGVDDEAGVNGSIIFRVLADGVKIYDSGPMYGWGPPQSVNVSIAGKTQLALIVVDAGDGMSWDHGDWADAKVNCTQNPPSTYTISGRVTGSAAQLTLSGTSSATTNTDGSGNYSFVGLVNGTYVVSPSQSSYTFTPSTQSVTINGANATGKNFTATAVPPPTSRNVSLSWTASVTTNIRGYNVYRAAVSGGSYSKLNASPITSTSYLDAGVTSGRTYYYVTTTLDTNNIESVYSNVAVASIP